MKTRAEILDEIAKFLKVSPELLESALTTLCNAEQKRLEGLGE